MMDWEMRNIVKRIMKEKTKLPKYIDIELNTSCNLHCEPCPYKETHKNPKFMRLDILEDIIDQIDWSPSLKFCQRGEPLLSSILIEAIKMATKKGLRTVINTNGFYLHNFAKDLIKAGLDEIILSDYGHSRQFQNGCMFSALNQIYRSPLKFTVKTTNYKKWVGIANNIIEPIFYDYLDEEESYAKMPDWNCPQLFERLIIDPDGYVRCCCGANNPQKYVGKIFFNSLKDIWNSSILQLYRKHHLNGESHKISMCRKCAYRRSFIK